MKGKKVQESATRRSHPVHAPTAEGVVDEAYGIIPVRLTASHHFSTQRHPTLANTEVLLVKQRSRKRDAPNGYIEFWAFPKGHAEPGETSFAAAQREVWEEVGLQLGPKDLLLDERLFERYPLTSTGSGIKLVTYWVALVSCGQEVKIQEDEVLDFAWFSWAAALEQARPSTSEVLRHAMERLRTRDTGE